jgi:hypothetical protein
MSARISLFPLLTQAPPVVAKSLALPGDDGTRLDERQSSLPTGPETGQPDPEQAIGPMEARAMDGLFVNRQLTHVQGVRLNHALFVRKANLAML